ncbi:hypothetical protein GCM10027341_36080 [Spirosoma knui]
MLTSLSTFLYRIASWKTLLVAMLLYVPFPAYILRTLEANMNALAGQTLGPIDLLIGYDPAKIQQMVAAYGPEGRAIYAQGELTADIAYPFIYTLLFCLILSLLFRSRLYTSFQLINIVPLIALLFDLLENGCIIYLLKAYPTSSDLIASLCSVFTNLKWAAFLLVVGLTLYGLVRLTLPKRQSALRQG